jgi:prepilin-type N-terminal cleavage/methylation domain-containing protein
MALGERTWQGPGSGMKTMRPTHNLLSGFTLVEMMVVVTITSVLALMAVQLGSNWTDNSKVSRQQASLQHAYSFAKAVALQNHLAVTGSEIASTLCLGSDELKVVLGHDCTGSALWRGAREAAVQISLGETGVATCVSLNSAGLPVPVSGCTASLDYEITAGSIHVSNKKLY